MKTLLILLLSSVVANAQELQAGSPVSGIGTIYTSSPTSLTIAAGKTVITISPTGKVTLGEGITLDEASKAFWEQIQRAGMKLACEGK